MLLATANNRLPFKESLMELIDPDDQTNDVVSFKPREKWKGLKRPETLKGVGNNIF